MSRKPRTSNEAAADLWAKIKTMPNTEKRLLARMHTRYIAQHGGTISRDDVRQLLGRKRLSSWDIKILERLVSKGFLTKSRYTPPPGPGFIYIYNMPDDVLWTIARIKMNAAAKRKQANKPSD